MGFPKGCPASPDLLNILFEAFHRWAAEQDLAVQLERTQIASISFADDLALISGCRGGIERVVAAYLDWCSLLGLQVTKVQVWSSRGPGLPVSVGSSEVPTSRGFRFVGIELGLGEPQATLVHLRPRIAKAKATTQRLRVLVCQHPCVAFCGAQWCCHRPCMAVKSGTCSLNPWLTWPLKARQPSSPSIPWG